jgi:hypothetical protein
LRARPSLIWWAGESSQEAITMACCRDGSSVKNGKRTLIPKGIFELSTVF